MQVRPLDRTSPAELETIAIRMHATLIEVLGPEKGTTLYTLDWLRERARFHITPTTCQGEIFVATLDETIIGHTIIRIETEENSPPYGYFSTTYVLPQYRRQNVADHLLDTGEAWFTARGLTHFTTNTSTTNTPLIRLYQRRGYQITLTSDDGTMVKLARSLP